VLGVRVRIRVRVRVRVRDVQETKRLGTKMLGYEMSGSRRKVLRLAVELCFFLILTESSLSQTA